MISRQLAVASAFSVFALSALALFAPGSARLPSVSDVATPTLELAAPAFTAELSLLD